MLRNILSGCALLLVTAFENNIPEGNKFAKEKTRDTSEAQAFE